MNNQPKTRRKSHCDRIYDAYLLRIQKGEITTQDRLIDVAIAETEGVSRMPVRDALMRLVHEGYLSTSTRGFVIPKWDYKDVLEVFEIRRMLDPRAAATAAQNLDDAGLHQMRASVASARKSLETQDTLTFYRSNEIFRNTWLAAVPNDHLRSAIYRYQSQVQAVRLATMTDVASQQIIISTLETFLDAFDARDAMAAYDLMLSFVIAAEDTYKRLKT